MVSFVLIHGAGHGGWCWRELARFSHKLCSKTRQTVVPAGSELFDGKVNKPCRENVQGQDGMTDVGDCPDVCEKIGLANLLREKGHDVHTPTLTGMGERAHLLSKDLTMQVHVDDIVNCLYYRDLENVILVGHSYAGLVISAVNERVPQKVSALVFLDAFIPENGKSGLDILEKKYRESWSKIVKTEGDGWRFPNGEASLDRWGIENPEIRNYMLPKLTDFSLNFLKTPISLSDNFTRVPKAYIRCTKPTYCKKLMLPYYERALKEGWEIFEIATGHDPMLTKPKELVEILSFAF